MRKAIVTLCTLVGLAMPAPVEGITLGPGCFWQQEEIPRHKVIQVKKGESLWKISKREYGTPWAYGALAIVNKIKDPKILYPGEKLIIPQGGVDYKEICR